MSLAHVEIVLVGPQYPGNVGAIARSAHNFGMPTIKIVGDLDVTDVEARKMALYGRDVLYNTRMFTSLADAVADSRLVIGTVHQTRFKRTPPAPVWDIVTRHIDTIASIPTSIVFGREDNGLLREEIDLCHALMVIPSCESLSFNLAHSVSMVLYEIYKNLCGGVHGVHLAKPSQRDFEEVFEIADAMFHHIDFYRGSQEKSVMAAIREIAYRSNLYTRDLPLIRAIMHRASKSSRFYTGPRGANPTEKKPDKRTDEESTPDDPDCSESAESETH